jgi:hypothetical protein
MSKERSPFSPGKPVSPSLFMGRQEQLKLVDRAIRQAGAGSPQYLFITGERGIGKSSLAGIALELAKREHGFVGAHAQIGSASTLEEACRRLYEALVAQISEKPLIDKVRGIFQQYISRVDLFGIGVEFKRDDSTRQDLTIHFLSFLAQTGKAVLDSGRRGILLIADDLNGVTRDPRFAMFLKSTVDQIALTKMREFPWVLALVGVPERMDDMREAQPSVGRIFQPIELALMDQEAAKVFYERAYRSVDHTWDDAALDFMSRTVGGYPVMWHELGDAAFWYDDDQHISMRDALEAMVRAAENVGSKYLKRPLYDELRSDVYRGILRFLAERSARLDLGKHFTFTRSEALKQARNLDNFINKMRKLGVLRVVRGHRGEYEFTSFLFEFYVMLQSQAEREKHAASSPREGNP